MVQRFRIVGIRGDCLGFDNAEAVNAKLNIRVPGWARGEVMPGDLYNYIDSKGLKIELKVNGKQKKATILNGYLQLEKDSWKKRDTVEVNFEMAVRKVKTHKKVLANTGKMAFERGPLVYCAEETDNYGGVLELKFSEEDEFNFEFDNGLFKGTGIIKGPAEEQTNQKSISLIPCYAWAHRNLGEMTVWFNY